MTWRSMSLYKRVVTVVIFGLIALTVVLFLLQPKPDKLVTYVYGVETGSSAFEGKFGRTTLSLSVKLDSGILATVPLPGGVQDRPGARVKLGIYTVKGAGPEARVFKFEAYTDPAP